MSADQENKKNLDEKMKLSIYDFAIIQSSLLDTYQMFKTMETKKDFSRFTEDQLKIGAVSTFVVLNKIYNILKPNLGLNDVNIEQYINPFITKNQKRKKNAKSKTKKSV